MKKANPAFILKTLGAVAAILNAVIIVNLSLIYDITFYIIFFVIGIVTSALMFTFGKKLLPVISVILGCTVSFVLTKNGLDVLKALSPLPFGYTLTLVMRGKIKRQYAIGISSFIFVLGFCLSAVFSVVAKCGNFTLSGIVQTYHTFFASLNEFLVSSFATEIAGESVPIVSFDNVSSYFNYFIGVSLGIVSAAVTVCAFLGSYIYKKILSLILGILPDSDYWKLTPSVVSCIFFLISLFFSFIFSSLGVFTLASANLLLIFAPFFFTAGLASAFESKNVNGIKVTRILSPFLLCIALFNSISYFISLCLIFGTIDSIKAAFPKKRKEQ